MIHYIRFCEADCVTIPIDQTGDRPPNWTPVVQAESDDDANMRDSDRTQLETAFPIIASAIERLYRSESGDFISKRQIGPLLLREKQSRAKIEALYKKQPRKLSLEQYAGNLVQWFSQRWTTDPTGEWLSLFSKFERSNTKVDGCWAYRPVAPSAVNVFPDEIETEMEGLPEGAAIQKLVNAYERNPLARQRCIEKYGANCFVCGFSFGINYGGAVDGFIHVHHLRQLSSVGEKYNVDPIADLRPVCPNCHAVIHHRDPAYSIEEVQSFLRTHGKLVHK